jgi:hypothetical protein
MGSITVGSDFGYGLRFRPLNELCRSNPSDVTSRHSTSAINDGWTHVALGLRMGLASLDFGVTAISSCFRIWLESA